MKQTIQKQNVLANTFTFSSLLKFSLPSIIMMLLMGLYTILDTVFVSRFVNTNALSAINICSPLIYLIVGISGMLALGSSAMLAKKMGEGKEAEARQLFSSVILLGGILGCILMVLGCIFITPILTFLGASPILMPYCKSYLYIQFFFMIFNILSVLFQNLFITAGNPALGLKLSIASGLWNVILDIILVANLGVGVAGASFSTGSAYLITAMFGILYFFKKKQTLYFTTPHFSWKQIIKICSNGASELIMQLSSGITTLLFNITMMFLLKEDGVAAITILIYSQFLLSTIFIGFSMGVSPIISYKYGNQDNRQIHKILRISMLCILIFSIIIFFLSMLGGTTIATIFAARGSHVYQITQEGLLIFPISFLFCGFNIFTAAFFTALSNGKVAAMLSFLRSFVFTLVFLFILSQWLQVLGVWLTIPLAEICAFLLSLFMLKRESSTYHYDLHSSTCEKT